MPQPISDRVPIAHKAIKLYNPVSVPEELFIFARAQDSLLALPRCSPRPQLPNLLPISIREARLAGNVCMGAVGRGRPRKHAVQLVTTGRGASIGTRGGGGALAIAVGGVNEHRFIGAHAQRRRRACFRSGMMPQPTSDPTVGRTFAKRVPIAHKARKLYLTVTTESNRSEERREC